MVSFEYCFRISDSIMAWHTQFTWSHVNTVLATGLTESLESL